MHISKKMYKGIIRTTQLLETIVLHLVEIKLKSGPLKIAAQSQGKKYTENHETRFQENF